MTTKLSETSGITLGMVGVVVAAVLAGGIAWGRFDARLTEAEKKVTAVEEIKSAIQGIQTDLAVVKQRIEDRHH